jgi:hypothetical protein
MLISQEQPILWEFPFSQSTSVQHIMGELHSCDFGWNLRLAGSPAFHRWFMCSLSQLGARPGGPRLNQSVCALPHAACKLHGKMCSILEEAWSYRWVLSFPGRQYLEVREVKRDLGMWLEQLELASQQGNGDLTGFGLPRWHTGSRFGWRLGVSGWLPVFL